MAARRLTALKIFSVITTKIIVLRNRLDFTPATVVFSATTHNSYATVRCNKESWTEERGVLRTTLEPGYICSLQRTLEELV